ncbi:GDSL-type esterase/lipase family protein [Ruminococcus sp.]|uniref:GDSL-type esterase/lipase family protein n=1 Tax=Ruminococcus sp. TaxID=41978 RepID=UPI0025F744DE|nr:GDSL-type esterase/lipase family protein [Ruminococcus sp.]MBQ9541284.1 RICIN domain-containing protein [Ruminococcus sp.]
MKLKKLLSGLTSAALALSCAAGLGHSAHTPTLKAEAATANWKFDFGGNGTASGYTGVSASDGYSSSKGYGFAQTSNMANVSAAGSGALSDAVQFKSTDLGNTFNVDLPNGLYEVKVTLGNTNRTSVRAENMLQLINLTGNNAYDTFQIPVTDGQLNIMACEGKAGYAFTMSALEITQLNTTATTNPTVWICGDSTVANYYNVADTSQHGWGQFFGDYVKDAGYIVRNMAASGQYAEGFLSAGQFDAIQAYGKSGDYYIISIGINDTNKAYTTEEKYIESVTYMVQEAKKKGMEVILVKQQGRRSDLQRSPLLTGRWFGGDLDKIGAAEGVQVADLFTEWQNFGLSMGYDGMESYYASGDDLHQSKLGAQKIAELMNGLVKIGKEPETMDTTKAYRFKNVNSGLYLEVKDGAAQAGANVQQWGGDTVGDWNVWRLKHKGYNYYEIWSYLGDGSTYLLDVTNASKDSGANIALNTNTNSNAQWFRFFKNSDGSYTMISRCSGDAGAIEVASADTSWGANVQQWEVNGHPCQHWVIEEVQWPVSQPEPEPEVAPTAFRGDANTDGIVDINDAAAIFRYLSQPYNYPLSAQGILNADVSGSVQGVPDGQVTEADASLIQMYSAGLAQLPASDVSVVPADPWANYYFAVDQTWDQGAAESNHEGFTKTDASMGASQNVGFVNLENVKGSSITFTVNAEKAGNYMTHIRYANGSTVDRKGFVYVNGDTSTYWQQSFPGTADWDTWNEMGIVLPLKAGKNTIKLESAVDEGCPNLDYISIALTDEPIAETYDPNASNPIVPISSDPTLFLLGDSTTMYYNASKQEQNGGPIQGWGYYLTDYLNGGLPVDNRSMAGRSSKKAYDEGRWQGIVDSMKAGDFVIIQFAINDAGASNADRYAPVCGDVNNPTTGSYEYYMTIFINDCKAKGVTPVLMSCTLNGNSYSGGKFVANYTNYTNALKQLSAKYSVPFVDANAALVNHYNSVGYDKARSYHMGYTFGDFKDMTHFNEDGAKVVAGVIANAIKSANINGLSNYVK